MHQLLETPTVENLAAACEALPPSRTALVLVTDEGHPPLDDLVAALRATGREFLGGIFPGVMSGTRCSSRGAVVAGIDLAMPPVVFEDLAAWGDRDVSADLLVEGHRVRSGIVLIDGLASSIDGWLGAVYDAVGPSIPFIGAGAGSMSLEPGPCLFTAQGVFQNAAIVGLRDAEVGIGVRHGWQSVSGPLVVDTAEGNVIRSLNWQNPLEVYSALVQEDSGVEIDPQDFFAVSKRFPFGLQRSGHEVIVRDPIRLGEEGSLVCVGEVPENGVLTLLKGDAAALVAAAGEAASAALAKLDASDGVFLVDCVSRSIFLEEQFDDELRAIAQALGSEVGESIFGVLSLGEVASSEDGPLAFLNKTAVVGALGVR